MDRFPGKAVSNARLLFHFCGWGSQVVLSSPRLQPGSHRPLFYLHTPADRAHPFPSSSSPGWQAPEGLEIPQVQRKRTVFLLLHFLVLDRYGLHIHTQTHLIFLSLDSRLNPSSPRFISQASQQCTAGEVDRGQRAVTQEEVWALRSQASGEETHRTEGERRDQRSGVAAVGTDEVGSGRSEGAPREKRGQIRPRL